MESYASNWALILLLAVVGFVSGFMNVFAGGGSLLTLPLMLWLGMPAPVANATNRIGLIAQNITATTAFARGRMLPLRTVLKLSAVVVPGALVGARLAVDIDEVLFRQLLAVIMVVSLWAILRGKPEPDGAQSAADGVGAKLLVSFFFMGIYAGFIQAGLGFVIIAALVSIGGFDLVRTNAIKVALVLLAQLVALSVFGPAGTVDWAAGASLALGTTGGAWVAAHVQLRTGAKWIQRVVVTLLLLFTARLVYEGFIAGVSS